MDNLWIICGYGWWFQPLWTNYLSIGMIVPNIWKKKNVPNHQPVNNGWSYMVIKHGNGTSRTNGSFKEIHWSMVHFPLPWLVTGGYRMFDYVVSWICVSSTNLTKDSAVWLWLAVCVSGKITMFDRWRSCSSFTNMGFSIAILDTQKCRLLATVWTSPLSS